MLNQDRLLEKGQVALSPFEEEGWWMVSHYATHPKQTRGWWENTTCFCWQKQASLPTCKQACSTSFKQKKKIKKKITENVDPAMVNVTYGNAICMHYVYTLNSILNTGVIFLNMGFVSNRLEILCVLCSSLY